MRGRKVAIGLRQVRTQMEAAERSEDEGIIGFARALTLEEQKKEAEIRGVPLGQVQAEYRARELERLEKRTATTEPPSE